MRRSASGEGARFSPANFARMNASMGCAGWSAGAPDGGRGGDASGVKDQKVPAFELERARRAGLTGTVTTLARASRVPSAGAAVAPGAAGPSKAASATNVGRASAARGRAAFIGAE